MSLQPRRTPQYRLHKPSGQAVVRLDATDHYLGVYGTPASHERYRRLIAEWLTRGHSPSAAKPRLGSTDSLTINELILAFARHAEERYRHSDGTPTGEFDNFRLALRPLRRLYGEKRASEFGPLGLRTIRDEMIRSGLARTTVNARINRIRRVFRWAVGMELMPASVYQSLQAVEGLRAGRPNVRESTPVRPVPREDIDAAIPFMPASVAAMVKLQLLTGMRPGEVMAMRGHELEMGDSTWIYRPSSHKNAWRGRSRLVYLGPRAREVLKVFLRDDPASYLFPPSRARSNARATTDASKGRYDRRTYRQAVVRACRRAGVPVWSPLQLRHNAATELRQRHGLEGAQVVLGHARADTTELYAERDLVRAREIMARDG